MAYLSPALQQATPLIVTHGKGTYLYDRDGRAWLDFTAGIGVTATGHCHPKVVEAAKNQIERLIHGQYGIVRHEPLLQLMERLHKHMPGALDTFFFANSGAEAVEAGVRLARNATGRQNVIVFQGSFHGRTIGGSALTTSGARFRAAVSGPLPTGVVVAPFPSAYRYGWDLETANRFCLRELDHLFVTLTRPEDTAAILIEPVQGEAGYLPASTEFFRGLRKRADEHGIMLIIDEVQAGMGRTGRFWAHEHFDARPDIVVFAKGIASGFPLSGIAASRELMARAAPASQGGTYSANAVACAAAIATLDVIEEEGLLENATRMGKLLRDGLEATAMRHQGIGDVRGIGLMQASEFVTADGDPDPASAKAAVAGAFKRGLIVLTCGPYGHIVRMIPALTVNADEIGHALDAWNAAVDEVYAQH
ncbi:aminotransferase class III-fold pyridoxal phosphate-dependent enzyme [Caballeronia sp. GAWG1-1]|uniref:aspartate aminotransferase family protein n=1 Tax=Caballeronia sp. GAWG1-1 TaxID=2921742 RepID=UPI002029009F|nr:aminotransferase class III-fold pyridoxal phosphate-dependent enzyme [Caballeronia sp. GAWG1-1]